ncbi:RAB6A-GEF complex partner protein 2-like [Varroa jacobsoni]|uniref:RAB6A-GEF complex partner protein 2 n=1 Tax=Varroa destructor TaxID=109461 RepID=A0A7M7J011_VARDE|nr:RAB6A-GEF complex partner protein 2-like [Varroa destructor]XP_022644970.1 RAB6A-GEF complex partner protein 2-like [Varroa destructor]XP_022694518.1 RAB6A-GEF complex partner protein 2-like [Varroa jacobsoni]
MIQIQTKLSREPVYIAGDVIECVISFKNISQLCESTGPEILAWSSAQLHCYCSVDEAKLKLPSSVRCDQLVTGTKETSFVPNQGEKGFVIYSSQPTILLCDLRLLPGDVKTFVYREKLPPGLPPSYKGQMVKYSYKISIGTQKINAASKLFKIPLKVFCIVDFAYSNSECSLNHTKQKSFGGDNNNNSGSGTNNNGNTNNQQNSYGNNPFLSPLIRPSLAECAMEYLEDVTAPRQPSYFNITQGSEHDVARFCLLKSNFRLGEDIVGTFDFSKGTIPCVQFSVTLQSVERTRDGKYTQILPYSKAHEICLFLRQTHVALPIPVHVAPSFETDLVELSWRLHFEFVMTPNDLKTFPPDLLQHADANWEPPAELDVHTMVWNLPVNIFPSHSAHIAARLNLQREFYTAL